MAPSYEFYVDDDSQTHPLVGKALREFLPSVFEGKYDPDSEPEMEWVDTLFTWVRISLTNV